MSRRRFVVVKQRLEIRERGVGAANQVEELRELGLPEHLQPLHDDRIAGQRDGEWLARLLVRCVIGAANR